MDREKELVFPFTRLKKVGTVRKDRERESVRRPQCHELERERERKEKRNGEESFNVTESRAAESFSFSSIPDFLLSFTHNVSSLPSCPWSISENACFSHPVG